MDFKYPYTDFHELNLDWFLAEFKKLTADWLQVQHDWEDEQQAFQDLHDYVQDYFANLNLYQEVHDILYSPEMQQTIQLMLSNISASQLPTVVANQIASVVASQLAPVVAAQLPTVTTSILPSVVTPMLPSEVSAWLAAHVDPDSGYVIDNTLTVSMAAADAKVTGLKISELENVKLQHYINLYDSDSADIETGGYRSSSDGHFVTNSHFNTSGYIPVIPGHRYTCSSWDTNPLSTHVSFYDSNKVFVSGTSHVYDNYVTIPAGCSYMNIPFEVSTLNTKIPVITEGSIRPPYNIMHDEDTSIINKYNVSDELKELKNNEELAIMTKTGDASAGIPKEDGTIATNFPNVHYHMYDISDLAYVYISGSFNLSTSYSALWLMKNGVMVRHIGGYGSEHTFINEPLFVGDCDELMLNPGMTASKIVLADYVARNFLNTLANINYGQQWKGKTWYAYGTSLTSITRGKYVPYLATMSGMNVVNKGIAGGGIGNLGAYSHGQVYNAICNITDGKLDADVITLETGANDVDASVPLGTIYDTGQTTLAGCLNDCLRYLQTNTKAQIIVTTSPASTIAPNAADQYYEWFKMVKEICDINMVHFVNNNTNMGYAKLTGPDGSDYVLDDIHQTDLGGYIMAENLWAQIRNIPVFRTVLP